MLKMCFKHLVLILLFLRKWLIYQKRLKEIIVAEYVVKLDIMHAHANLRNNKKIKKTLINNKVIYIFSKI